MRTCQVLTADVSLTSTRALSDQAFDAATDGHSLPGSDIQLGPELGRGGFGSVYSGSWLGVPVAVKCRNKLDSHSETVIEQEAAVLAKLRHPFICQFFGTCVIGDSLAVVMELLKYSLHDLLHTTPSKPAVPQTYRLAHEIAQGIAYLHRNHVLHRDIKPGNVMLDARNNVKVCDFGLSRIIKVEGSQLLSIVNGPSSSAPSMHSTVGLGTLRYMAPEVWGHLRTLSTSQEVFKLYYDYRADVYSFAMLLWELAHCEKPFAENTGHQVAIEIVPLNRRPPLNRLPSGLEALGQLAVSCWDQDPAQRPIMSVCTERLAQIRHGVAQGPYDNVGAGPSNLPGQQVNSSLPSDDCWPSSRFEQ